MLVAISVASVLLVNQARDDNGLVVHTVEVENQLSNLLLEIRRAESAARGYLLTLRAANSLTEHETAAGNILPDTDKLAKLTADNPVQVENYARLRRAIEQRLTEFARGIDCVKNKDVAASVTVVARRHRDRRRADDRRGRTRMRAEEDRLFAMRTARRRPHARYWLPP